MTKKDWNRHQKINEARAKALLAYVLIQNPNLHEEGGPVSMEFVHDHGCPHTESGEGCACFADIRISRVNEDGTIGELLAEALGADYVDLEHGETLH